LFSSSSQVHAGNLIQGGFVDFNVYPYQTKVNHDTTFTINAFLNLSNRFSYFSLTNFSNRSDSSKLSNLDTFFTEQNLRWQISYTSPFELTIQSNLKGSKNNRHRLGVRWSLNKSVFIAPLLNSINLKYFLNWHAIQFVHQENNIWQLEHAFSITFPYISDRLYLRGFADHIFNENLPATIHNNPVVAEAQLGYKLLSNTFAVVEYRVNQYRRSNVNNIAVGLEYKKVGNSHNIQEHSFNQHKLEYANDGQSYRMQNRITDQRCLEANKLIERGPLANHCPISFINHFHLDDIKKYIASKTIVLPYS
jgi:hypothetical protein